MNKSKQLLLEYSRLTPNPIFKWGSRYRMGSTIIHPLPPVIKNYEKSCVMLCASLDDHIDCWVFLCIDLNWQKNWSIWQVFSPATTVSLSTGHQHERMIRCLHVFKKYTVIAKNFLLVVAPWFKTKSFFGWTSNKSSCWNSTMIPGWSPQRGIRLFVYRYCPTTSNSSRSVVNG